MKHHMAQMKNNAIVGNIQMTKTPNTSDDPEQREKIAQPASAVAGAETYRDGLYRV